MLSPTYPIRTARLLLRPFEDGDLDDLHAFYSRPEVVRYLYWEPRDREQLREALEQKKQQGQLTEEGTSLVLAVLLPEAGRVIGEITLKWRSREHQQGEVGYVFNPEFHGHGYATEAGRVALSLGFDELELHRIYGRCDARNVASARLMERLGMRLEAHFIHNELFKGEWGEEFIYAMLRAEWHARQDR